MDYKFGKETAFPLFVQVVEKKKEKVWLPEEQSFCSTSENVIISTIKKCEDDNSIILRCYEMEGENTETVFNWFKPIKDVRKTNIIEEDGGEASFKKNSIFLNVPHNSIETLKINFKN